MPVVVVLGQLILQQFDGGAPDQPRRLPDGGQRHDGRGREVDVVVTDQGDIPGHADAVVEHEGLQQSDGEQVVGREDRVRALSRRPPQQLLADAAALQHGQGLRAHHVQRRAGNGVDGRPGSGFTVRHLVQARGPAHERDLPGPALEQVRHGHPAALDVVDGQGAVLGGRRLLIDQHHRRAAGAQPLDPPPFRGLRGDEHPAHPLFLEQVQVNLLAAAGQPGVADDDGLPVGVRGRLGSAGDLVVERVSGVLHDQADGAGAARLQLPGDVVAHIAQFLDGLLDPAAPVLGDHLGPVDHIGDRSDRHLRFPGDVLDAHRESGHALFTLVRTGHRSWGAAAGRQVRAPGRRNGLLL